MKIFAEDLQKLWVEFGDVPVNEKDEIEEDFYLWEKGTDKLAIWAWFDEKLPEGLVKKRGKNGNEKQYVGVG